MDKYEHAKFIIERFDHYYDASNNKGSFFIGLNTFIFGGICVGYVTLHDKVMADTMTWTLLCSLLISNIISMCFTVLATVPYLKGSHQTSSFPSLLYFGGIAKHEIQNFKEKFGALREESMLEDLLEQVHCLSIGLDSKYQKMKYASLFVVTQLICLLPLFILIVINLKHDIQ